MRPCGHMTSLPVDIFLLIIGRLNLGDILKFRQASALSSEATISLTHASRTLDMQVLFRDDPAP